MKQYFFLTVLSLITISGLSQFKKLKYYKELNIQLSFCSGTILLDSTNNFFQERGCEERSNISIGKYSIEKNIIKFKYEPFENFQIIKSVKIEPAVGDTSRVRLLSIDGEIFNAGFVQLDSSFQKELNAFRRIIFSNEYSNSANVMLVNLDSVERFMKSDLKNADFKKINVDIYLNIPAIFLNGQIVEIIKARNFNCLIKNDYLIDRKTNKKMYELRKR